MRSGDARRLGVSAWLALAVVCVAVGACRAQPNPERWQKSMERFAEQDRAKPPPKHGVVFVGSSSIALWTDVAKQFSEHAVLNRGFGGSILPDVLHYLDRVVLAYEPKVVVLFCGGNDLNAKRTPEQVHEDFQTFVRRVHEKLPKTHIVYISIHRPPGRQSQAELISRVNALVAQSCATEPKLTFVNVHDAMLKDGKPNPELYRDPLHPSAKGYALWVEKLRPVLRDLAK
jgi:lysophospholipase L1-like esterase